MLPIYYVGLDLHKKVIAYCIKHVDGRVFASGTISSNRPSLRSWVSCLPGPWFCAIEATMFSGWVYDFLVDYAVDIKVAHPEMLKAITASKKKNDRDDSERLADLLRVDLLPECYMAPPDIRELRRVLRFRKLIVHTAVKLKNRMSGMLMEVGADYNKRRLHGKRYFSELLDSLEDVPDSVLDLLQLSRGGVELFTGIQCRLVNGLRQNDLIRERVELLQTIPGIGEITALTWVLEIAEAERFTSVRKAVSYCGLCSAQHESAGKSKRGPMKTATSLRSTKERFARFCTTCRSSEGWKLKSKLSRVLVTGNDACFNLRCKPRSSRRRTSPSNKPSRNSR